MDGKLDELPGQRPTIKDWADHTTTIFPEVRLKKYLEMRGADAGPWSRLCALPALWMGIFYDAPALAAAWDLCKDWKIEDHERLRADVARRGLKAEIAGRTVQDVAKDMVAIARSGPEEPQPPVGRHGRRDRLPGRAGAHRRQPASTPAERLLELYNGRLEGRRQPGVRGLRLLGQAVLRSGLFCPMPPAPAAQGGIAWACGRDPVIAARCAFASRPRSRS